MKIDSKKINTFLKSMDDANFIYLKHMVEIRDLIQKLIKTYDIPKKDFCERMKLNQKKYADYVSGNYNYTMMDIAKVNAYSHELHSRIN